jgi:hypothetical protein
MPMIVRVLLSWLLLGIAPVMACAPPAPGADEPDASALAVVEPKLERAQGSDAPALATLVSLKNTSSVCFDEIVIEARYFDAGKQLIDSKTEAFFGIVVPPGKTVAFRLDSKPLHALERYATQEVTVVNASTSYSSRRAPSPASIGSLLAEWLPFALYVLLMIGLLLWLRSKKSPQGRALVLSEQHNDLMRAQNRQLERIAEVLERRNDNRGAGA